MTRKQYAVHTVRDEPARLQDHLDHIAAEGGRVVSVIWQPARQVTLEPGLQPHEVASGYLFPSLSCKGRPLSGPIKRSPLREPRSAARSDGGPARLQAVVATASPKGRMKPVKPSRQPFCGI